MNIGRIDATSAAPQQYLELANPNAAAVDISFWRLSGALDLQVQGGAHSHFVGPPQHSGTEIHNLSVYSIKECVTDSAIYNLEEKYLQHTILTLSSIKRYISSKISAGIMFLQPSKDQIRTLISCPI
jgi:hypothetical protein